MYVAPKDQYQSLIFNIFPHMKPVAGVARKRSNIKICLQKYPMQETQMLGFD